ncbi:MAG TPA: tRNA 4-thiouridine(8) synthase ThiI [Smithella sp.]|nr:tRNA 4-thiouridine(8) synthase ThiI [Smithella sp.]
MIKAIALFSGGLDSILAAELIRRQNIDVLCLSFTTPFFDAQKALAASRQINLPLEIQDITSEHLQMLKAPRYGYGKNMNPCIDCHALMLHIAGRRMQETGRDFILTGEVLGQRPMSQNKQSLYVVAKNSGYQDYILRPLSAILLDPIKAEREKLVDRSKMLAIQGRGRKQQMQLATDFGIVHYAPPAGGCLLTDPIFSRRLRDLLAHQAAPDIRDYELLKYGRHFRISDRCKIIVGRNRADNEALKKLIAPGDLIFNMAHFPGPLVLVPNGAESDKIIASALCVRYSDAPPDVQADVICMNNHIAEKLTAAPAAQEDCQRWII